METDDRQMGRIMSRRDVLTLFGATGAALLVGCGTTTPETATQSSAASAATASSGATASASAAASAATPSSAASAEASASPEASATSATQSSTASAEATTTATTGQDATPAIVAVANAFLATLSESEKDTVLFDWTDTAQKQRWSNFPDGAFDRAGLLWGDMSEAQQTACLAVLQAILSAEGYTRILAEWNADDALAGGDGGGANFGTAYYYTAVIGTPSESDPWQWQWGGHHVTVNATIVGPNLSLTPSFIGVEPIAYTDATGATVRPLGDIEDDAFALVNALDATQQQTAILGDTAIDLVLGPGQDGKTIASEGLPASEMTAEQQAAFLELIEHYTGLTNDEAAAARLAEIETTLDATYLAWYGPTTEGDAAYFRVTGPTIVIEYSPQEMGGDPTAHIHGIYRDPTNDYGVKYTQ